MADKSGKMTELSYDHKPDNDEEFKRIKAGGGFVEESRVQGVIAVSRAIGDWEYKNPNLLQQLEKRKSTKKKLKKDEEKKDESPPKKEDIAKNIEDSKKHLVTSFPDIKKVAIKDTIDFVMIACDGIWDCFTNEQAVKYVRNKRAKGPKGSPTKLKQKMGKAETEKLKPSAKMALTSGKSKPKGETSFIIEDMMQ